MEPNVITEGIDRQEWLEPIADGLQQTVAHAFAAQGQAGDKVEDFLHGKWLGHPLHTVLTDVPLGAWTAAVIMDGVEAATGREDLAPGADAAIAIGLCGAVGSAVTGLTDWHKTEGKAKRVGLVHGVLNIGATLLFASSWIMRRKNARVAGRTLSFAGYAVVTASAYLGGELVYKHKVGVEPE